MENDRHLKYNMYLLVLDGIWPLRIESYAINFLYRAYMSFIPIYFFAFVLSEYIEVFFHINDDFFIVIQNLQVSLLYTTTFTKMMVCRSERSRSFIRFIKHIEKVILDAVSTKKNSTNTSFKVPTNQNLSGEEQTIAGIFETHVRMNHKLGRFFMVLTVSTVLPFYVNPVLTALANPQNYTEIVANKTVYLERPLVFSSWFPYDKYKYFGLTYSCQIFSGMVGGSLTCSTDLLLWSFCIFIIGQLKILQKKFINIGAAARLYAESNNVTLENGYEAVLKKAIIFHQIIINYVNSLDDMMKTLMLLDFSICSLQMAVIGIQVVVIGFGWPLIFAIEYLCAMLIQLFLFYWFANEISLESIKVADAIWESNFYECPRHVQRSLQFVMQRSLKPLTLNVGPFYAMSNSVALSVVRMAYSYVALMRQVYK